MGSKVLEEGKDWVECIGLGIWQSGSEEGVLVVGGMAVWAGKLFWVVGLAWGCGWVLVFLSVGWGLVWEC